MDDRELGLPCVKDLLVVSIGRARTERVLFLTEVRKNLRLAEVGTTNATSILSIRIGSEVVSPDINEF